MTAVVLLSIATDLRHFAGYSPLMRTAQITVWIGSLALAPWIAMRLPQLHRFCGGMLSTAFVLALIVAAAGPMLGWSRLWLPPSVAIVSGVAAYVFLFDRDVRRFRHEQLEQRPKRA